MQNVAPRISVSESSWLRKRRKVEPVRRCGIGEGASLANAVWPLTGRSIVGDVAAEDRRVRRSAAADEDTRNFPSSNQSVYESVGVAEHAVSVAEGKAIHRAYRNDMFEVVVALRIGAGKQAKSDWAPWLLPLSRHLL